jgi:hypothetical protein
MAQEEILRDETLSSTGLQDVANALSRCAQSTKRSFMGGQIGGGYRWRQADQ